MHHGGVQGRLLLGQGAIDLHFQLVRQILDDGAVGLEPAQDERPGQPLQALHGVRIAPDLHRQEEFPLEPGGVTKETGIEKVLNRPEIADVVFHWRAGQRDAPLGAQGPRRPGLLGFGVLDVLRFVQNHRHPVHLLQPG